MSRGAIEVVEFDPSRRMPPVCTASFDYRDDFISGLRRRHHVLTSIAVAVSVAALHLLALAPAFWRSGGSEAHRQFGSPVAIQALVLDDEAPSAIAPALLSTLSLRPIRVDVPREATRFESDPVLAALYGHYLGQIRARIERAWLRPRTGIGASMFRCEVAVWQHRNGSVQMIKLRRCNGSAQWQQSLIEGIQAASPLPAPPSPAVFAHRVILHFKAVAYRRGIGAGEYESVRPSLAADMRRESSLAGYRFLHSTGKGRRGPAAIQLRITGSHVEVDSQGSGWRTSERQ